MKISVYYTVNMGMCIRTPGHNVWVDIFPDIKTPAFSKMEDADWDRVKTDPAIKPTEILMTHCHPDHYSHSRMAECTALFPEAAMLVPAGTALSSINGYIFTADDLPVTHVSGNEFIYEAGGLHIRMLKSEHSSEKYADVPHYSIFLTQEEKTIFISGDAHVTGEALYDELEKTKIDLAILNFPWTSLSRGRSLTEHVVAPEHVLFVHIPNAEDNNNGYREVAESGSSVLRVPDVRLAMTPYTEFSYDLS